MSTRRACDVCYRRKIQCSIPSPDAPCNWCSHHGKECTFNRETPRRSNRRSRVTLGHIQELLQRIQQLEDAQGHSGTEGTVSPVSTYTDGTVICADDQGSMSMGSTAASRVDSADIVDTTDTIDTIDTIDTVATITTTDNGGGTVDSPLSSPAASSSRTDQFDRLARHPSCVCSPTDHPASLSTGRQDSSLTGLSARIHPLRHCLGPNWFFNGMPIFSDQGRQWLASRTGQTVDWTRFRLLNDKSTPVLTHTYPRASLEEELNVTQETVQKVVAVYATSSFRLFLPVLDPVLMKKTIGTAFEPVGEPRPAHIAARACILAALAVIGRLERCGQVLDADGGVDTEQCASKARDLIQINVGDWSLETLQAALLMHLHQMSSGRWHEASFLLSTACRIISALGGHLYHPRKPQPLDATTAVNASSDEHRERHIRQLFWLCYMLDKDLSLRTGHIPLLTDEYCDLTLPENYTDCFSCLQGLDEFWDDGDSPAAATPLVPHLPGDPRLSMLKERVYRTLFTARALRSTDGLLMHIRQLDVELERWRQSVPAAFRPMLAIPTTVPLLSAPGMGIPQRMYCVYLQLEYHQLITIIHTTMRRYSSSSSSGEYVRRAAPGERPMEDAATAADEERAQNFHTVIHSSVDLSLEASRSTLWCLQELIARLGARAFRFIVFYPTVAAMSLYLNMVIHPIDNEAQFDVERLVAAANVIRSMPTQKLTTDEADQVRDTSNFILGLVWLGTSAITGATGKK